MLMFLLVAVISLSSGGMIMAQSPDDNSANSIDIFLPLVTSRNNDLASNTDGTNLVYAKEILFILIYLNMDRNRYVFDNKKCVHIILAQMESIINQVELRSL